MSLRVALCLVAGLLLAGCQLSPVSTPDSVERQGGEEDVTTELVIENFENGTVQYIYYVKKGTETKHGPFMSFYQGGDICVEGVYVDGKEHGLWIYYWGKRVRRMEGMQINGDPHGRWVCWDHEGRVVGTLYYDAATGERFAFEFYEDGPIEELRRTIDNEERGRQIKWHENGRLSREYNLDKDGERINEKHYDEDGKPIKDTKED